jgi:hypothetical protein
MFAMPQTITNIRNPQLTITLPQDVYLELQRQAIAWGLPEATTARSIVTQWLAQRAKAS